MLIPTSHENLLKPVSATKPTAGQEREERNLEEDTNVPGGTHDYCRLSVEGRKAGFSGEIFQFCSLSLKIGKK